MVGSIAEILNLTDAKNFLNNANSSGTILTESELRQIIDKMDTKVPGSSVTLMYSGEFGEAKAWQIAEKIGAESGGKVTTMGGEC